MWRLAVVMVLVAVLAMRTEGARVSLPNSDAGDREGRHWLDQADDMRGAPGGQQKAAKRTIMARMMARTLRGGSRRMSCYTRVSGQAGDRRGTWCGHV